MSNLKKEKQILIGLFFFALLTIVIGACTDYYDLQLKKTNYERVTPLFDGDTKKFGVAFGQAFKKTIRQAKAKNIRPSDKDKLNALAYDNSVEEFRDAGLMDLEESDLSGSIPAEEYEFLEDGSGGGGSSSSNHQTAPTTKALTATQKQVFAKVNQAMSSSESYLEATDKLADINNGIPLTVPAQEQVGLQRAIAALYYTLDAIDDLVAEGILKGQSEKAQLEIRPKKVGFSFLEVFVAKKREEVSWWKCTKSVILTAAAGVVLFGAIKALFIPGLTIFAAAGLVIAVKSFDDSLDDSIDDCGGEEVKVNDDEPSKEDDMDGNNDGTGQHEQLTLD